MTRIYRIKLDLQKEEDSSVYNNIIDLIAPVIEAIKKHDIQIDKIEIGAGRDG